MPDKITIYQGPHERLARTRAQLEQMVVIRPGMRSHTTSEWTKRKCATRSGEEALTPGTATVSDQQAGSRAAPHISLGEDWGRRGPKWALRRPLLPHKNLEKGLVVINMSDGETLDTNAHSPEI